MFDFINTTRHVILKKQYSLFADTRESYVVILQFSHTVSIPILCFITRLLCFVLVGGKKGGEKTEKMIRYGGNQSREYILNKKNY